MNERIKELAIEADKDVGENISFEFCEKFAELIVKECITQVEKIHVGSIHSHAEPWNSAVEKCAKEIKKYFDLK